MPAVSVTSEEEIVACARRLLEQHGAQSLTMRAIAAEVGVKGPSLYKRVRNRRDVLRLVLDQVADELTTMLEAAASTGDPVTDLRAIAAAYRQFAHANPVVHGLLVSPDPPSGSETRARQSSTTLLARMVDLTGPETALPAARTVVAWLHGFITMELADAFRLGGDTEAAWSFGLDHILESLAMSRRPAGSER